MVVKQCERSESKLKVFECAMKLAIYTVQQCQSDKVFPKKCRWVMANRLVNECLDACSCVKAASSYSVNSTFIDERERLQRKAIAHLETMLFLLNIAYQVYGINGDKIGFWTGLIVSTLESCKAWAHLENDKVKDI